MASQKAEQRHIDAMKSIADTLEPFTPEMRRRIWKAVAIILDIPFTEPAPAESP